MEKIKHKLGVMDLYPIAANKTQIENNPFLQAKLKDPVDAERLYAAVKKHCPSIRCLLVPCVMRKVIIWKPMKKNFH